MPTRSTFACRNLSSRCGNLRSRSTVRLSGAPLRTGLQLPLAGALRDEVHTNFEQKWSGPDGVVIDVSHTGWESAH